MKSGFINIMTIFYLMITNVISISDTDIFYPQLLSVKVPVRPPSIASIQILSRLRSKVTNSFGPQRRMIFPFNRLLLSIIAPRLMRFQFDIMLHSIISELVKKVVVPIMGSITGNDDRGRQPLLSQLLSSQTPSQSPPPPFDMKQMITKAQNAIQQQGLTIQNAIRMNGQPSAATSMATLHEAQSDPNSINQLLQYNNLANFQMSDLAQQTSNALQPQNPQKIQYIQTPNINSMESLMASGQPSHSNQMSFMPNIQANSVSGKISSFKQEKKNAMQLNWPTKSKSSVSSKPKKQMVKMVKMVPQYEMELSGMELNEMQNNNSNIEEELITETPETSETPEKENESHEYQLNYVDTVVPNYGNQLSTEQINHYSIKDDEEVSDSQLGNNNNKSKQQIIEEIERASRWNDILVNMDKHNAKRRLMQLSKFYK